MKRAGGVNGLSNPKNTEKYKKENKWLAIVKQTECSCVSKYNSELHELQEILRVETELQDRLRKLQTENQIADSTDIDDNDDDDDDDDDNDDDDNDDDDNDDDDNDDDNNDDEDNDYDDDDDDND